jgi:hypothetical protein
LVLDFLPDLRHNVYRMKVDSILGHTMKVGSLYELIYNVHLTGESRERWRKPALYLGEDPIHRSDGVTVVNHKFLVGGAVLLADRSFLTSLREIENEN